MSHPKRLDALPDPQALLRLVDAVVRELRPASPLRAGLDSQLDRDLGLDSLARVELLARIERRFDVRLPAEVLGTAETPAIVRPPTPWRRRRASPGRSKPGAGRSMRRRCSRRWTGMSRAIPTAFTSLSTAMRTKPKR